MSKWVTAVGVVGVGLVLGALGTAFIPERHLQSLLSTAATVGTGVEQRGDVLRAAVLGGRVQPGCARRWRCPAWQRAKSTSRPSQHAPLGLPSP